jgi:hypothetical protein
LLVELDAFSGRPNPSWELDEVSSDALRKFVAGLPVTSDRPAQPPGLGYRGFVLTDGASRSRAYKGYVIRSDGVLADPSLRVEHFLLDHLPREVQDLRQRISVELEKQG